MQILKHKNVFSLMFFPNKNPHIRKIKKPATLEIIDKDEMKILKKYKDERMKDTTNMRKNKLIQVNKRERRFFFNRHLTHIM